ncbi:nucleoid-associated protein, partial [Avibacterium avium]|uniref:nucleoid-associated protein n=1 Tax=Avibacterium avium TaxID=751 RepID=UPI003BF8FE2A
IISVNLHILRALCRHKVGAKYGAMIRDYSFEDTIYINPRDIRFAGLIDITLWKNIKKEKIKPDTEQNGELILKQYISFLNAAEYFKSFFGCSDAREPKKTTALLVRIIPELIKKLNLSASEASEFRKNVYSYLKGRSNAKLPFKGAEFANFIAPSEPEIVTTLLNDVRFSIPDNFTLIDKELEDISTLEFKTENWSIELNVDSILDKDIVYDKKENVVILRNPPQELIDNIESINDDKSSRTL